MVLLEVICGLASLALLFYYYFIRPLNFWKNHGVNGPKPIPIFGNFKDTMLVKMSIHEYGKKVYDEFSNEKLVGVYARTTPILFVTDPDLIKDVLIKDFSNFISRGLSIPDKVEPLSQHLFNLEPKRWRPLRTKLTPVFTSGKLKEMFHIIKECCDQLDEFLGKLVDEGKPIDIREIAAKYTTDVIGSCAFGLNMNSLSEEDSEFRKMGKKALTPTFYRIIRARIRDALPWIYNLLAPLFYDAELNDFFINSIKQTMEYREKEHITRHDFIDVLIGFKNHPDKFGDIEINDTFLAAQAFVFFIAGFETSASTISNLLYEIAQYPDIQEKLRDEILKELEENDGDLSHNSVKNMKYLHKIFQETLRKYPVVATLFRKSAAPYTFAGTNVTIPANQKVWIPVYGIHLDPKIYPNPNVFDPERFTEEAIKSRHPMHYLPFGDGPRNCIGDRFAVNQVKAGICKILQNYKVDICDKTEIPFKQNPATFIVVPKNGLYLKITRLKRV